MLKPVRKHLIVFIATFGLLVLTASIASARSYIVQRGDTLSKIASENDITIPEIVAANNLTDPNRIYAGQILEIPDDETVQSIPVEPGLGNEIYHVQLGDTLTAIANRFGRTVNELAQANDIVNPNHIFVGQELLIPARATGGNHPVARQRIYFAAGTTATLLKNTQLAANQQIEFLIDVKEGQTLSVGANGVTTKILTLNGRELATSSISPAQMVAPYSGDYVIRVHNATDSQSDFDLYVRVPVTIQLAAGTNTITLDGRIPLNSDRLIAFNQYMGQARIGQTLRVALTTDCEDLRLTNRIAGGAVGGQTFSFVLDNPDVNFYVVLLQGSTCSDTSYQIEIAITN